ncbi:TetR/AcrR family transcriptional regulator [Streptomyces sp. RS10V-4]|uniref:TetR/AcrR family transcriptional regulator n=1 Tax=Streptomyces rhizoryzae TaxID=2932493 RepID=UPI002003D73B|nr:TetR/AcrR family transcriptional regulator [Streptomyces rhizoryzae]MCK7625110.1 TetR/AcrR family transcriptional regulator [Streptomyces rhizoryzae]
MTGTQPGAARSGPLPSGRHRLSREEVVASQRLRMLTATADAMRAKGYAGTSVADIIRRAGVSRETFYQQFRSKEDCFVQALDAATDQLAALLAAARQPPDGSPGPAGPEETFRRLLRRYLHALAEHSAFARLFLVEVYAAGSEAMARRMRWQGWFADGIAEIFPAGSGSGSGSGSGDGAEERRFACEAVVAAAAHLVTVRLVADDLAGLRALEDPLVRLAVRLLG